MFTLLFSGLMVVGLIVFVERDIGNKTGHHNRTHEIDQEIQLHKIEQDAQQTKDWGLRWGVPE